MRKNSILSHRIHAHLSSFHFRKRARFGIQRSENNDDDNDDDGKWWQKICECHIHTWIHGWASMHCTESNKPYILPGCIYLEIYCHIYSWSRIGLNGVKDNVKEERKIVMEALEGWTFYKEINQKQFTMRRRTHKSKRMKGHSLLKQMHKCPKRFLIWLSQKCISSQLTSNFYFEFHLFAVWITFFETAKFPRKICHLLVFFWNNPVLTRSVFVGSVLFQKF